MMSIPDELFDFSFFPDYSGSIRELAQQAMPESWAFVHPQNPAYCGDAPILERYIRMNYRCHAIAHNEAQDTELRNRSFAFSGAFSCFHTGLITQYFQPIYALFELNYRRDTRFDWVFKGFFSASSPKLKVFPVLPQSLAFQRYEAFWPEWEIRTNYAHILQEPNNIQRLPEEVRKKKNLPLLLQSAVLYGRSLAQLNPSLIVPQLYCQQVQYLLPICLTDLQHCDLAMTLTPCDGFYLGTTCLTLEMAYINARILARPSAFWLAELVKEPTVRQCFPYEAVYHMDPLIPNSGNDT